MIGVIVNPADRDVVREFFELFKTPWEFYRSDTTYDVVLCAGDGQVSTKPKLLLVYGGKQLEIDEQQNVTVSVHRMDGDVLRWKEESLPIYGNTLTFSPTNSKLLTLGDNGGVSAYLDDSGQTVLCRIGYDLFEEVRKLLTEGQPAKNAAIPALDLHIGLLRELIVGHTAFLIEIPPVPEGYSFIACLTHDVDHPSIRFHKWDHTTLGFLYRALAGSVRRYFRGRIPLQNLIRNWVAAAKLPFVQIGMAKDFWACFVESYRKLEKEAPSTFFVIPFKNYPGRKAEGIAPGFRASGYGADDIAGSIKAMVASGCEVGLHGIDAWIDGASGKKEIAKIQSLSSASETGVRMHWLYFDQTSPAVLESAGALYDSTVGYNETVGYRAGSTQVFKPLITNQLLELPLHAMDTVLFYPNHLGLSPQQATERLRQLIDNAAEFGGCLTINWHDRSTAPERLWDECYRTLLQDLKNRGAWFCTAGQAVAWFRQRRAVVFERDASFHPVQARVVENIHGSLTPLRLRTHKRGEPFSDAPLDSTLNLETFRDAYNG